MANFFDQFDAAQPAQSDAPVKITVRPQSIDDRSRDLAIRTIYGEASAEPDEGKAAVAAVIRNRLESGRYGKTVPSVVLAPHQFEPWMRPDARSRMMAIKPGTPDYDRIGGIVDRVFSGEMPDPTKGATHFYAPQAQAALGRQPPRWAANQEPLVIGRHSFFAPEGRVAQAAPAPQAAPAQQAAQPPGGNFFDQFDAPPAAAPPLGQVAARFGEPPVPDNASKLRAGLEQRAADLTTGRRVSPAANMAIAHGNLLSAASQSTTPHVDSYKGKLLSTEVHEDDGGNLHFRDPQTGAMVKTDNTQHVVLRDPADNIVKVYSRDAATNEGPVTGIARVLAPGLGAGAPTARAALTASDKVAPRASDIFATAKPHYREFAKEASGIEVPAATASGIVDRLKAALEKGKVPEHLAPEVYRSVEHISKATAVDHLRDVKELVGQSFKSNDPRVRQAAGIAAREINKIIAEVSPTAGGRLKTADDIYSTASSVRQFDSMAARAGAMETRKLYRGNVGEKMREYLSKIVAKADDVLLKDPNASTKSTTGFSNDEINAFREYVGARKGVRYAAEASPTKGIMRTFMEGAAVTAAGPVALAIPAIGYSANVLARYLDKAQLATIRAQITKRSPEYAKAVQKSVERFEQAQIEFMNQPTPNRLAAAVSASRALSAGLTKDGVTITSGQLLKQIAGQPPAAAEEQ